MSRIQICVQTQFFNKQTFHSRNAAMLYNTFPDYDDNDEESPNDTSEDEDDELEVLTEIYIQICQKNYLESILKTLVSAV